MDTTKINEEYISDSEDDDDSLSLSTDSNDDPALLPDGFNFELLSNPISISDICENTIYVYTNKSWDLEYSVCSDDCFEFGELHPRANKVNPLVSLNIGKHGKYVPIANCLDKTEQQTLLNHLTWQSSELDMRLKLKIIKMVTTSFAITNAYDDSLDTMNNSLEEHEVRTPIPTYARTTSSVQFTNPFYHSPFYPNNIYITDSLELETGSFNRSLGISDRQMQSSLTFLRHIRRRRDIPILDKFKLLIAQRTSDTAEYSFKPVSPYSVEHTPDIPHNQQFENSNNAAFNYWILNLLLSVVIIAATIAIVFLTFNPAHLPAVIASLVSGLTPLAVHLITGFASAAAVTATAGIVGLSMHSIYKDKSTVDSDRHHVVEDRENCEALEL
jgi:hypothetical protein